MLRAHRSHHDDGIVAVCNQANYGLTVCVVFVVVATTKTVRFRKIGSPYQHYPSGATAAARSGQSLNVERDRQTDRDRDRETERQRQRHRDRGLCVCVCVCVSVCA